jgi:hypothetical protein
MPGTFRQGRSPVEKPGRPSRTCRAISSASAKRGAFLFGYFLLGKQEKVTRPPAGGRKPAAGEPGRGHAKTERKSLDPSLTSHSAVQSRWDDGQNGCVIGRFVLVGRSNGTTTSAVSAQHQPPRRASANRRQHVATNPRRASRKRRGALRDPANPAIATFSSDGMAFAIRGQGAPFSEVSTHRD